MRKIITIALLAAVLGGCAAHPRPMPANAPLENARPQPAAQYGCDSQAMCDAMWSEAIVALQRISGAPIMVVNDFYAQTVPHGRNHDSSWVKRAPSPDGGAQISARFACTYACSHDGEITQNLFRLRMKNARSGFTGSSQ